MHDPRLSEIAADLDRAAEEAVTERRPGDAIRLLHFAVNLRHLIPLVGDNPMSAVAEKLHEYKQALIAANARADAAQADAAKNAADVQRLNDLQTAGRILDDADVAALAEPVPGSDAPAPANGPADNAGAPADGGAGDGNAPQNTPANAVS